MEILSYYISLKEFVRLFYTPAWRYDFQRIYFTARFSISRSAVCAIFCHFRTVGNIWEIQMENVKFTRLQPDKSEYGVARNGKCI